MTNYKKLLDKNKIQKHSTSPEEIKELLGAIERDMKDASLPGLSTDRAFATAYNSAMLMGKVVMAVEGYRTKGADNHRTTFDFLEMTGIAEFKDDPIFFNSCRKKRNTIDYDHDSVASAKESEELIGAVDYFYEKLKKWLKDKGYSL